MTFLLWLALLWLANSAFTLWVVWYEGAARLVGWQAHLVVDWLFAHTLSAEEIERYVLVEWVVHTVLLLLFVILR